MSKNTIYNNSGIHIQGEVVDDLMFLHCDIDKPSKSALKECRDVFELIMDESLKQGHELIFSVTPNRRFIDFLGKPYEVIGDVNKDNVDYEVVLWDLK